MSRTKRTTGKQRSSSSKARKPITSFGPLFLNLRGIPSEINVETIQQLRHNMVAWTNYIDRLSSRRSIDANIKICIARARLIRGVAHTLLSEWQEAAEDLSQAILTTGLSEPEKNTAYTYRAQVYDALNQNEASIHDWTYIIDIIERASSHPERFPKELAAQGYASRARISCRKMCYEQAIADCDRALAFHDRCAEAYSVRGRAYSLLNSWSQAIVDCTKAIELQGWPVHYYRRGLVHKQIGNYTQAFFDFEQAYQREPENELFKKEYIELLMLRLIRMVGYVPSESASSFLKGEQW